LQPIEETLFALLLVVFSSSALASLLKENLTSLNTSNLDMALWCHSTTTYEQKLFVVFLFLQNVIELFKPRFSFGERESVSKNVSLHFNLTSIVCLPF
jgi:hypothetical protein